MQIKKRRAFKKPEIRKDFTRINERIRVPEVFCIDENGQPLGKITTEKALEKARKVEMDLVEVNPKARPPVCKIMNYGKIKYEKEKQAHKQKLASKKNEIKGVRLTFKIKGGDLENRINSAKKFIADGNSVRIEMVLKGREKAYSNNAKNIINDFLEKLGEEIKIIQPTARQGGKFSAIIAPNKKNNN